MRPPSSETVTLPEAEAIETQFPVLDLHPAAVNNAATANSATNADINTLIPFFISLLLLIFNCTLPAHKKQLPCIT
jgi:hypothetical protein